MQRSPDGADELLLAHGAGSFIGELDQLSGHPALVPVFADCDDGYAGTTPVGSKKPNPWGLCDILGNVAAWTEDCYVDSYRKTPADGNPNTSESCTFRVVRGGSWSLNPPKARAVDRDYFAPGTRLYNLGFRVARTVPP